MIPSHFSNIRMKGMGHLLEESHLRVNSLDSLGSAFKVYRLDTKETLIRVPKAEKQGLWYGIYFISQSAVMQRSGEVLNSEHPSITLLKANFKFIIRKKNNSEQGFLLLLNETFLSKRLNQKLKSIPLFIDQGGKPIELNVEQVAWLNDLFRKIVTELCSTYKYKQELLVILLMQLMHFMIKNFTLKV